MEFFWIVIRYLKIYSIAKQINKDRSILIDVGDVIPIDDVFTTKLIINDSTISVLQRTSLVLNCIKVGFPMLKLYGNYTIAIL